jgi:hypothetical protein
MPAIVPPEAFDLWLDCRNVDALTATELCVPVPDGLLEAYEVSPAVNRADNDGPELIAPASAQPPAPPNEEAAPAKRTKKPKTDDRQPSLF